MAERSKPWYREPWPWILMAGPAIVIVAGAVTVTLAIKSNDGLVSSDYYKQGLAVNEQLSRSTNATKLGLVADLRLAGESVAVHLTAREAAPVGDILLTFTHPTRAGLDQNLRLSAVGQGQYAGKVAPLLAGRWDVVMEDPQRKEWRLAGSMHIPGQTTLHVKAEGSDGGS